MSDAQGPHSSESGTSQETPRRTVAYVELLKRRNEPLGLVLKGHHTSIRERETKVGVFGLNVMAV